MKLTDILHVDRIVPLLEATDSKGVLAELVKKGFSQGEDSFAPDEQERMLLALEDREARGSTGIKDGLAIPHGKVAGFPHLSATLGFHPVGVPFGALDKKDSHFFVALLSPEHRSGEHLKALARIARLFSDGTLQKRLMECDGAESMFEAIAVEDARY
ncbi:MAG: PTS sugar transporter subunit IIA [Deltaproteobacteria bacterium]|nr:PTS sugar transporter subunit IIA [Deltaproteobacteria bacterium]